MARTISRDALEQKISKLETADEGIERASGEEEGTTERGTDEGDR